MKAPIITYSSLKEYIDTVQGRRIVLVGGCFDVLHFGHICFLEKARASGDLLLVALESDTFIEKRKHRAPVHSQEERAYVLTALRMVGAVVCLPYFEQDVEYNRLVQTVRPVVIAVTNGDRHIDKKRAHAEAVGAAIEVVTPLLSTFSTSNILDYEHIHRSRDTGQSDSPDPQTD